MGAYLLIIGKRPWRGGESSEVAPRVRLLGLSYILVFGAAMVQIITQPSGVEAEGLRRLRVLGAIIVVLVAPLRQRAPPLSSPPDPPLPPLVALPRPPPP